MPTASDSLTTFERGWIFRSRPPLTPDSTSPVAILIHGWSGDENSMEIFSRSLPSGTLQLFPRAPFSTPEGGFAWVLSRQGTRPSLDDFTPVCTNLMQEIQLRLTELHIQPSPLDLIGFSQGAALSYALSILFPDRIRRVAALAGFLPTLTNQEVNLSHHSFYIAHGTRDETIPVELARASAARLEQAGASVTYCEGPSGHKLSADCFAGLHDFFA